MGSGIEGAYGCEPEERLHGCPACAVTWFGVETGCWVCGGTVEGPVAVVPPNGTEAWSAARCADGADDEETAVLLRRVTEESGGWAARCDAGPHG